MDLSLGTTYMYSGFVGYYESGDDSPNYVGIVGE